MDVRITITLRAVIGRSDHHHLESSYWTFGSLSRGEQLLEVRITITWRAVIGRSDHHHVRAFIGRSDLHHVGSSYKLVVRITITWGAVIGRSVHHHVGSSYIGRSDHHHVGSSYWSFGSPSRGEQLLVVRSYGVIGTQLPKNKIIQLEQNGLDRYSSHKLE